MDEDGWEIAKPKKKGLHNKKPASKKNKKKAKPAVDVSETTEQMQNLSMKEEGSSKQEEKVDDQEHQQQPVSSANETPATNDVIVEEEEDFDEDDDAGWITPENVTEHRAMEMGVRADELNNPKSLSVACMTGDFAMQVTFRLCRFFCHHVIKLSQSSFLERVASNELELGLYGWSSYYQSQELGAPLSCLLHVSDPLFKSHAVYSLCV